MSGTWGRLGSWSALARAVISLSGELCVRLVTRQPSPQQAAEMGVSRPLWPTKKKPSESYRGKGCGLAAPLRVG